VLVVAMVLAAGSVAAKKEPKPSEGPFTSDSPAAQTFVDAHNAVRAGVQKPNGYTKPWVPIPPLQWSDEIALGAQEWANHLRDDNKCKLVHSDVRLGENLAMGKGLEIRQAVDLWASEGKNYHYAPVYEFEIPVAHYTQVVWRTSTQVGCGIASCGKTTVVVCRYNPPGNHIGKSPF